MSILDIKSNLSESMVERIDLISQLFDEILFISNKKLYNKIANLLSEIFSHHSKKNNQIEDFNYYFGELEFDGVFNLEILF